MRLTGLTYSLASPVRLACYVVVATVLATFVVFILLAQYAQPSSDDFCMAAGVYEEGLFAHLWGHYFEWSGRYTGNALYALYPLLFGFFDGYRYIPAIVILTLFLATVLFLSTLFQTRLSSRPVLLAALGFVGVYLLGIFSPASSLYWMAGAFTYQSANILLLVMLGLMLKLAYRQHHSRGYAVVLALLLLVVILGVGANETGMLAFTAVTLLAVLLNLRTSWVKLWPWLLVFVVASICFAVVYFSPGNAIRATDFPLRHDLLRSINGSLSIGLKTLWLWISNPVLLVSSLLVPFAVSSLYRQSNRSFDVPVWLIAILVMSVLTLPVVLQFPAWWAMGGWPPARTLDAIYFLFLVGWYLSIGALTIPLLQRDQVVSILLLDSVAGAISLLLLSVLFSFAVLQSDAFKRLKTDLFYLAEPYQEYLIKRYALIEAALESGQLNLAVPDYPGEYPRSLYFNDIMHDPEHWRNVCYADYFGLESIRREKSGKSRTRRTEPRR